MRIILIGLLCLGAGTLFAQNTDDAEQIARHLRRLQSPQLRLEMEAYNRVIAESQLDGRWSWTDSFALETPGGREYLGLSNEQAARYTSLNEGGWFQENLGEGSPLNEAYAAMRAVTPTDDPFLENATEEQKDLYYEAAKIPMMLNVEGSALEKDALLTEEQRQKILELRLQMGETTAASMEALGLSEEQKKQMADAETEFKSGLAEYLDANMALFTEEMELTGKALAERGRKETPASSEDVSKWFTEEQLKVLRDETRQKKREENDKKLQTLLMRRRMKLMEVLTDEQLDKFQKLVDNMPEFMKKRFEALAKGDDDDGDWKPGPQTWKPGDALPEDYKKERQKRGGFPQQKTTD